MQLCPQEADFAFEAQEVVALELYLTLLVHICHPVNAPLKGNDVSCPR
jgi:hypothetical protein